MRLKGLLQRDGWHENVEVNCDDSGVILSIEPAEEPGKYFALPGFRNSHSHAFQYAMAGIAENHSNPKDDFWSWREAMYALALSVDPDQLEAIAAMLYSEMLRHGYTHVVEFHYLHHDRNGKPYANPAEMSSNLIAAASKTGINITVVPVYYKTGNFGKPASSNQRRFTFPDVDQYLRFVEAVAGACKEYEYANYGIGVHSLRAAPAEDVVAISTRGPEDVPFHIHIAEQQKEVEECVAFYGKRPVEWLLENVEVDRRFNLVHATHLLEHELMGIAASGANVVLCPTTEGNLGDGIFSVKNFKGLGGNWSLGSDSNVCLNPFEEIRLLDYGQRLVSGSRNTFGEKGSHYAVETAFDAGSGASGIANNGDFFEIGDKFNACLISTDHPLIAGTSIRNVLNAAVYSSDASMQSGSVVNGRMVTPDENNRSIKDEFTKAIRQLENR